MLSVIICSRQKKISEDLFENIKNTIGCEYELIVIDNSENKYSIFEAYNQGIVRCKGGYLCFIHDDILFHTNDWGKTIHRIFNENIQIGLIGIGGAKIKTRIPSTWWDCPIEQAAVYAIQHYKHKGKVTKNFGFDGKSYAEVVVIDGVFMAMRKDKKICFNTELQGFHNYDLNISFEYIKHGYTIVVTNDILIEHFSTGTLNEEWVDSTYKIHNLYKSILPLGSFNKDKKNEIANAKKFINECLKHKKNKIAYSIWTELFYLQPITLFHLKFWKTILSKKMKIKSDTFTRRK